MRTFNPQLDVEARVLLALVPPGEMCPKAGNQGKGKLSEMIEQ